MGCLAAAMVVSSSVVAAPAAHKRCDSYTREVRIGDRLADAGMWGNFRNKPGSVRFESYALLQQARAGLKGLVPPVDLCPSQCRLAPTPLIVFASIPRKYKHDYADKQHCQAHLTRTRQTPLFYKGRAFTSLEAIGAWLGDFTQGKGVDGQDLYRRCDASCSPQYTYLITTTATGYLLDAQVVCGHARDKDDNTYDLASRVRWYCVAK